MKTPINIHGPHEVTLSDWVQLAPFEKMLGMNILDASNGNATLTMPFIYQLAQGAGLLHGGATMSLADTSLAMAVKTCLPEGTRFGTISFECQFILPVHQGLLSAYASVWHSKERHIDGEVEVKNENGKTVFTATASFKVAKNQEAN